MPTRLIREGAITSDRVNLLDCAEEVFYRRLLNKVDDYGLYDARPSVLRASLFPLRLDRVREADCSRWIAACVKAGLIVLYETGGKPYLKVLDTNWQIRSEPKYPLPPENSCKQPETVATVVVDVDVVGPKRKTKTPLSDDFVISDRVRKWAAEHGFHNIQAHFDDFVTKCRAKDYRYVDWDAALMNAMRNDWAKIGKGIPQGQLRVAI